MVKTRQQKSKPKPKKQQQQHPQVKKQGKQADISLDALGLKIIKVTADAFMSSAFVIPDFISRALADQLEGNEEEHGKYRSMVVQYIVMNREMFEPFIEDDVPFDEYCQSMEKDGTWAGHMELQAASLVTRRNICIHRMFTLDDRNNIVSNDENGNSEQYKEENVGKTCEQDPSSDGTKTLGGNTPQLDEKKIPRNKLCPCGSKKKYKACCGSVSGRSYHDEEHYNSVRLKEDPYSQKADADISASSNQAKAAVSKVKGAAGKDCINTGSMKLVMAGSGCESAEKVEQVLLQVDGDVDAAMEFLIAEQGAEECTAANNSLTCHANGSYNQPMEARKGRKERKQSNKGVSAKSAVYSGSDGGPPDMGALCI
ncbi:hypothetical protein GOBAR_DD12944 [Gossypium barbadense]|nr:hypothetical protein GOBAR_DD12944 [Gossypium barbadense]